MFSEKFRNYLLPFNIIKLNNITEKISINLLINYIFLNKISEQI